MDLDSSGTWGWIWLGVAVVFALGEIGVAGSFFLLPFAGGAVVAAVASALGAPVGLGWLLFLVVSAACSAVLWPLGRRMDRSGPHHAIGATRWVGRQGVVLQDIPGGLGNTGLIRLEREEWRAESLNGTPIKAGATVLVGRVDGTRLVVMPVDDPADGGSRAEGA